MVKVYATILKDERNVVFVFDTVDLKKYENNPIPKLHTDLLSHVIDIRGIVKIEIYIRDIIPFEDRITLYFRSKTSMLNAIMKIHRVFGFITDGKYGIDVNDFKIIIQW